MLKWKWLWLVAGVLCGTVFSASSEERVSPALQMNVMAVSAEDAQERAADVLRERGHPALRQQPIVALLKPTCVAGPREDDAYRCEARMVSP